MKYQPFAPGKLEDLPPCAGPRLHRPPDCRDVYINIQDPGRYRLRFWTEAEFAALAEHERPASSRRKGSIIYAFEYAPRDP